MAKKVKLKDRKTGEVTYPLTSTSQVLDKNGKQIGDFLDFITGVDNLADSSLISGVNRLVVCNLSKDSNIGYIDNLQEGRTLHVILNNVSGQKITISVLKPLAETLTSTSIEIEPDKFVEVSITKVGSKYYTKIH